MIHDPQRLKEVIEEIAEWTLQQRRDYIAAIEAAFGRKAADQIRDGLKRLWATK